MAEKRLAEVRQARLQKRQALINQNKDPYPAEARRTHTCAEFINKFDELQDDTTPVILVGRIKAVRSHGGVAFIDLTDAYGSCQLQVAKEHLSPEIFSSLDKLDVGDFLQATGIATTTSRGTQTLQIDTFHLLSKSIRPIPNTWYGLKDHEARYRNRELDFLFNKEARNVFITRSEIISWLRQYFKQQGYLEVETPILQNIPGGAAAKPFVTHHNALGIPLYMRISAELHLKRLLVAGLEKVFEIERRFRNEGIDRQHNPEFTMLESQWAYADYEDLMDFTEDTLEQLCSDIHGNTTVVWQEKQLSFAKPFKRASYIELVSSKLGIDILKNKDPQACLEIFKKNNLELPQNTNYTGLVDDLFKQLIRPSIEQPTLLYDYPAEMVPLAKRKAQDSRIAEMFQLLVAGFELSKCYTELNDPVLQRQNLQEQQKQYDSGNEEAQQIDEEYLRAMEYGMPPNAGWSLGIDRFVMLLTDSASIRDVITYPLLRPTDK